jgi:hypothetical protein
MRILSPSGNFTRMSSSKSKVEGSKGKPSLKSQKGSVRRESGKSARSRDSQGRQQQQPVEDLVQRDGYALALITALVYRHDEGPEKSVDRAETILKLSWEAATRRHAPRTDQRMLNIGELASVICGDSNQTRAWRKFQDFLIRYTSKTFGLEIDTTENPVEYDGRLQPVYDHLSKWFRIESQFGLKRKNRSFPLKSPLPKERRYSENEAEGWKATYEAHCKGDRPAEPVNGPGNDPRGKKKNS